LSDRVIPPRLSIEEILIPAERIRHRVAELAEQIGRDYQGRDLVLVGALKGAIMFLADLSRALPIPHRLEFLQAASYGNGQSSSGEVKVADVTGDLKGYDVLLVEDIYDTGLTIRTLLERLRAKHPASLEVCTFLVKNHPHNVPVPLKYTGFHVPDLFVVGYGLDYAQHYRNLPYVGVARKAEG